MDVLAVLTLDVGGAQTGYAKIPWATTTMGIEGSSPTVWTTDDGELAALAFSIIRSQSVASVLCIIVSERNPLTTHIHICSAFAMRRELRSIDDARTT